LQDAPSEALVDGRTPHQHGEIEPAALQFVYDKGHLFTGADQQRAQTNGVRFFFNCTVDDGIRRYLFPEVDHVVAIVGKNGLDQVFANIMHISVNRRQEELAFAGTFLSFKEVL